MVNLSLLLGLLCIVFSVATDAVALEQGYMTLFTISEPSTTLFYSTVVADLSSTLTVTFQVTQGSGTAYLCNIDDVDQCVLNGQWMARLVENERFDLDSRDPRWSVGTYYIAVTTSSSSLGFISALTAIPLDDRTAWQRPAGDIYSATWRYFSFFVCDTGFSEPLQVTLTGSHAQLYMSGRYGHPDDDHCTDGWCGESYISVDSPTPGLYYIGVKSDVGYETSPYQILASETQPIPISDLDMVTDTVLCPLSGCLDYFTVNLLTPPAGLADADTLHVLAYPMQPETYNYVEVYVGYSDDISEALWSSPKGAALVTVGDIDFDNQNFLHIIIKFNDPGLYPIDPFPSPPPHVRVMLTVDASVIEPSTYVTVKPTATQDQSVAVFFKDSVDPIPESGDTLTVSHAFRLRYPQSADGLCHLNVGQESIPHQNGGEWHAQRWNRGVNFGEHVIIDTSDPLSTAVKEGMYYGSVFADTAGADDDTYTSELYTGSVWKVPSGIPVSVLFNNDISVTHFSMDITSDILNAGGAEVIAWPLAACSYSGGFIFASQEMGLPDQSVYDWMSFNDDKGIHLLVDAADLTIGTLYFSVYITTVCEVHVQAGAQGSSIERLDDGQLYIGSIQDTPGYIEFAFSPNADPEFGYSDYSGEKALFVVDLPNPTNDQVVLVTLTDVYGGDTIAGGQLSFTDTRVFLEADIPLDSELFLNITCMAGTDISYRLVASSYDSWEDDQQHKLSVPTTLGEMEYFKIHVEPTQDFSMSFSTDGNTIMDAYICPHSPPLAPELMADPQCLPAIRFNDLVTFYLNCDDPDFIDGDLFVAVVPVSIDPDQAAQQYSYWYAKFNVNYRLMLDNMKELRIDHAAPAYFDSRLPDGYGDYYTDLVAYTSCDSCQVCISFLKDHPQSGATSDCDLLLTINDGSGTKTVNLPGGYTRIYGSLLSLQDDGVVQTVDMRVSVQRRAVENSAWSFTLDDPTQLIGQSTVFYKIILSKSQAADRYSLTVNPKTDDRYLFYMPTIMVYASTTDPLPDASNAQWVSRDVGGILWFPFTYSDLFVDDSPNLYISVVANGLLTSTQPFELRLDSQDNKVVKDMPFMSPTSPSLIPAGDSRTHAFGVRDIPLNFLLSPCMGVPKLLISTSEMWPTDESAQYTVEGGWGEEVTLRLKSGTNTMTNVNYFVTVTDGGLSESMFSYQIAPIGADPRPGVPYPYLEVVENAGGSFTVTFSPAAFSGSPSEVEYAIYVMQRLDDEQMEFVHTTACGMEKGGMAMWQDTETASEWMQFEEFKDSYTVTTNMPPPTHTNDLYLNVLVRSTYWTANGFAQAYSPIAVTTQGAKSVWPYVLAGGGILLVLGAAAGWFLWYRSSKKKVYGEISE